MQNTLSKCAKVWKKKTSCCCYISQKCLHHDQKTYIGSMHFCILEVTSSIKTILTTLVCTTKWWYRVRVGLVVQQQDSELFQYMPAIWSVPVSVPEKFCYRARLDLRGVWTYLNQALYYGNVQSDVITSDIQCCDHMTEMLVYKQLCLILKAWYRVWKFVRFQGCICWK